MRWKRSHKAWASGRSIKRAKTSASRGDGEVSGSLSIGLRELAKRAVDAERDRRINNGGDGIERNKVSGCGAHAV
jgi:hypothetical protein